MNKKLKAMQIIPELGLAGAEIMVENLTYSLTQNNIDVSVVSLYDYHSAITDRLENKNIPVFYLVKKKGFDINIFFRLYNLFKRERPDVVHTHLYILPYVVPAARLARVPVTVHTIHNIAKKEVGKRNRKINNLIYKYCGVIPVAISPLVKKSVIEEYRFKKDDVPMIYNGIDLNKCIHKNNYDTNKKISILHIGRFSEQKNHIGLIESFKLVHDKAPNTVLKLIGAGVLEEKAKNKVKELNLEDSVEFLGLKSNVYTYLSEADIFILPSLWEGMPITIIEAMASGLPIVATNVGGIPDMIEDSVSGLLVNISKERIADALLRLINDRNLRQRLGNNAKDVAKKFSAEEMASEYAEIYGMQYKR